jgi:serine/threonine-protein kinase HipA
VKIDLEVAVDGVWEKAGTVTLLGKESEGTTGACLLEYDNTYAFKYLSEVGLQAFSLRYPVNFSVEKEKHWPAFLLDLMPSGAARRTLESKLKLRNAKEFDWQLLTVGACNPIGNVRVQPANIDLETNDKHEGFQLSQILDKEESFIDYALECGSPISGTTGVAGDAPKFTLAKSVNGNWYPGGSISNSLIESEWIIKFLRGRTQADHIILESEAGLYRIAEKLGLRGGFKPTYHDHALLIPRFDSIKKDSHIQRIGVESLYSAMGVYEFGVSVLHESVLRTIHDYVSNPLEEIKEYILRDIYNYLISNTDNHGRNTSFIKHPNGCIELAPIYDCAPMKLDPQMITRSITWGEVNHNKFCHGLPEYSHLWQWLNKLDINSQKIEKGVLNLMQKIKDIDFKKYPCPKEMLSLLEDNRKTLIRSLI